MNTNEKIYEFFEKLKIPQEKLTIEKQKETLNIKVDVEEDEKGLFIGRHAETLESLQRILSFIINNDLEEHQSILLDIGGYREERLEKIMQKANEVSELALQTGQSMPLPRLSATERRQVHMQFAENEELTTFSQGEGEDRRLFIAPNTN